MGTDLKTQMTQIKNSQMIRNVIVDRFLAVKGDTFSVIGTRSTKPTYETESRFGTAKRKTEDLFHDD
jgi:hypothetical protein